MRTQLHPSPTHRDLRWLHIFLLGWSVCAADIAANEGTDPVAFLEFTSIPDGRCQILSQGGKLRLIHNRHQQRTIDFRLVRMFAGNHPQGLVTGTLAAGTEGMKLGCTEVDGRPQDWVLQRARFVKE